MRRDVVFFARFFLIAANAHGLIRHVSVSFASFASLTVNSIAASLRGRSDRGRFFTGRKKSLIVSGLRTGFH